MIIKATRFFFKAREHALGFNHVRNSPSTFFSVPPASSHQHPFSQRIGHSEQVQAVGKYARGKGWGRNPMWCRFVQTPIFSRHGLPQGCL